MTKPVNQDVSGDACAFRPFGYRQSYVAVSDQSILAGVAGLLLFCRPSHIVGTVAFIIIDAVKRVLQRWRRPDIFQKFIEANPSWFDQNNSALAVVLGIFRRERSAAVQHSKPCAIFLGHFAAYSMAVLSGVRRIFPAVAIQKILQFQAPAALCQIAYETIAKSGNHLAAFAATPPSGLSILAHTIKSNYHQTIKCLSHEITTSLLSASHDPLWAITVRKSRYA